MATGGKDDFQRDEIAWTPPDPPLVVSADRSGIRILGEVEREEGEPVGPSLEQRMDAPGHLGEEEAEPAEVERGRGEVAASMRRTGASPEARSSPSPPDAPATPSQPAQEAPGSSASTEPDIPAPEAQEGSEEIEATLAEPLQPSPTISEIASQTEYVPDDPGDERRCARDERRCVEKAADGRRCRSYAMRGQIACAGHSGKGLAASPTEHASLAHASRRQMKLQRQMVAPGGKWGPRAAVKLETLRRGQALAEHAVAQALSAEGFPAVQSVVKLLDAVDPLVTVEATTTTQDLLSKISRGEDPTWSELRAVFGPDAALSASEAAALPAETG